MSQFRFPLFAFRFSLSLLFALGASFGFEEAAGGAGWRVARGGWRRRFGGRSRLAGGWTGGRGRARGQHDGLFRLEKVWSSRRLIHGPGHYISNLRFPFPAL